MDDLENDDCPENIDDLENNDRKSDKFGDYSSDFITSRRFNTRDELLHWVQEQGHKCRFVIVIGSFVKGRPEKKVRATLNCEISGAFYMRERNATHKDPYIREKTLQCLRVISAKKCQYPFELKVFEQPFDGGWKLKVMHEFPNHGPAEHIEGHTYICVLTPEEQKVIEDLSYSHAPSKTILWALKSRNGKILTTIRGAYNFRAKY